MKVYWTPEAIDCLKNIEAYIREENPKAAKSMAVKIIRSTERLGLVPESGRQVPEYPGLTLREVLERPYRVIYQQANDQVQILSVQHYRQRLPRRPKALNQRIETDAE